MASARRGQFVAFEIGCTATITGVLQGNIPGLPP
jgi:hypothetical protein